MGKTIYSQPIILIIEDDATTRDMLRSKLELAGYIVLEASNGKTGLARALSLPRPNVILLDLIMPDMNGLAVLEQLRNQKTDKPIPVILMTNYTSEQSSKALPYVLKCNWDLNDMLKQVRDLL